MDNLRELWVHHTLHFQDFFIWILFGPATVRNVRPSRSPESLSDFPKAISQKRRAMRRLSCHAGQQACFQISCSLHLLNSSSFWQWNKQMAEKERGCVGMNFCKFQPLCPEPVWEQDALYPDQPQKWSHKQPKLEVLGLFTFKGLFHKWKYPWEIERINTYQLIPDGDVVDWWLKISLKYWKKFKEEEKCRWFILIWILFPELVLKILVRIFYFIFNV